MSANFTSPCEPPDRHHPRRTVGQGGEETVQSKRANMQKAQVGLHRFPFTLFMPTPRQHSSHRHPVPMPRQRCTSTNDWKQSPDLGLPWDHSGTLLGLTLSSHWNRRGAVSWSQPGAAPHYGAPAPQLPAGATAPAAPAPAYCGSAMTTIAWRRTRSPMR